MTQDLFLLLLALLSFVFCVMIGGFFAWVCGFDLNEPEYYEHRRTDETD